MKRQASCHQGRFLELHNERDQEKGPNCRRCIFKFFKDYITLALQLKVFNTIN